ncbi:MAG: SulP family inorganic anion transporter [Acidimicrobiia bacterium]
MSDGAPPKNETGGLRSGIVSGFATGLFSIPEGMAYAQLAGVNPVYGLYSGMVGTLVASLTTGTILMISTLTSAIALTTGSILDSANLSSSDVPGALFTLTLLAGAVMLAMGLLRMGGLVDFVSNAVMTGFVLGASLLILIGELGDFAGYDPTGANKLAEVGNWFANIASWDIPTVVVGSLTVILVLLLKAFGPTERSATVLALVAMTVLVAIWDPPSVALVMSISEIPNSLPAPMMPDFSLIPELAAGSVSIALVALVQGAGISTAYPNPGGKASSQSRDFIGEGLGNVAGAFFQSMPTGGSLSRTGISVGAGATSRWGGIFAALWLGLLVLLFGSLAELVPLAVISGLLFVIAGELIMKRVPSVVLVFKTSLASSVALLATFVGALFIPLQWTIFIGAGLSLLTYLDHVHKTVASSGMIHTDDGHWKEVPIPESLVSNEVTVVAYRGSGFFAELPPLRQLIPSADGAQGAVLILRVHSVEAMNSTFQTLLERLIEELHEGGNHLILEGVHPEAIVTMERTGTIEVIGRENVIPPGEYLAEGLEKAWERAQVLVGSHADRPE